MSSIGIDFGTTNSTIVSFDNKNSKFDYFLEKDFDGKPMPYPSVVWYHDNQIIVGQEAKKNFSTYCDKPGHCMIKSIKSILGTNKRISVFGTLKKPYEIAAEIIKYMKNEAGTRFQAKLSGANLNQAVFTVPVNFNGKQREDLRKAAQLAGINVQTFIHEPFGAIIGYIYNNQRNLDLNKYNGKHMLVFDWGGGTLDITVVKAEDNKLFEIGTSEMSGIAGDKFDEELKNFCINRFKNKFSYKYNNDYLDEKLRTKNDKIIYAAEQCKIKLSTLDSARVNVDNIIVESFGDKKEFYDIDEEIKRTDFETCIEPYVTKAINKIYDALKIANINSDQVSLVLLTGGTSRIPLVINEIRKIFGSRVITVENSDTVIAEGAAVVSEKRWLPYLAKNIMVQLSDESYWVAFERGMPLLQKKMSKEETFTCIDNRDKEAKIIIAEGYNTNKKDKNIGILNVPTAKNLPNRLRSFDDIDATFDIDDDFVLTVSGYSEYAGLRKSLKLYDLCFGIDLS